MSRPCHAFDLALLRFAVAAACMARGLSAEEAEVVTKRLEDPGPLPQSTSEAYETLSRIMNEVRSERQARR